MAIEKTESGSTLFAPPGLLIKWIVAGVLALNLIVAILIVVSLKHSKQQYYDRALVTTRNVTHILDENISGIFSRIDIALLAVSDEVERQLATGTVQRSSVDRYIIREHARLPELITLRVTDASGDSIYGSKPDDAKSINLADRNYFTFLRNTPHAGLVISKPLIGKISGKRAIALARRINQPDGTFAGLVYVSFPLEYLIKSFSAINIGALGSITLIDSDFTLVARYPEYKAVGSNIEQRIKTPAFHEMIRAGRTTGTYSTKSSFDSVERIYSFRKLSLSQPFYVFAGVANSDYLASWRMEVLIMSLFMAFFLIITSALSLLLYRELGRSRQAERAVTRSENRFRLFVENANDIVFCLSIEGIFTYVSPNWKDAFGYDLSETVGRPFVPFVHPDDVEGCFTFLQKVLESGEKQSGVEYRVLLKNGNWVWYAANGSLIRDIESGEVTFLGIGRDISERKDAEDALRESDARHQAILHTAMDGFWVVNSQGRLLEVNATYCRMCGYDENELLALSIADLEAAETKNDIVARMQKVIAEGEGRFISRHRRKDGTTFDVEISVQYQPVASGQFVAFIQDITDRMQAEHKRHELEQQFQQAQKMESLGIMAGGIAHDFNNLLQSILGNIELAARELPSGSAPQKLISKALISGKHASHITNLMLTYAGKGFITKEGLDLNELVRENSDMFRIAATTAVTMELHLSKKLPYILADNAQIQQVIMNLITNAAESIEERPGKIRICTRTQNCDQEYLARSILKEKPEPGHFVQLEVNDNGCGMSETTLKHLFDPFFTTKFTGRGMGMSAVLGITRSHFGALFVESELGKGTTFRVLFPIMEYALPAEPLIPVAPPAVKEDSPENPLSGVALVVDDEKPVLKVCEKMVSLCGFTVITAHDGIDAVARFREHAEEIDVVLMDLTMPNMDGITAMEEIYRIRPDVKIILASGFNEKELSERITFQTPAGFVRKPYNMRTVENELRRVMKEDSPSAD